MCWVPGYIGLQNVCGLTLKTSRCEPFSYVSYAKNSRPEQGIINLCLPRCINTHSVQSMVMRMLFLMRYLATWQVISNTTDCPYSNVLHRILINGPVPSLVLMVMRWPIIYLTYSTPSLVGVLSSITKSFDHKVRVHRRFLYISYKKHSIPIASLDLYI